MANSVSESVTIAITVETEQLQAALKQAEAKAQATNERIAQSTRTVGAAGAAAGKQYAGGLRAAAEAAETLARTGRLSGEAARTAVAQIATSMAPFLPGGIFVTGIGIASLAVIQHFARIREEARKTTEESRKVFEDIEAMRKGGRLDDITKQAELLERNEIRPKEQELARLETRIATLAGQASALSIEGRRQEAEEAKASLRLAQQRRAELELEIDLLRARFNVLRQAAQTVERQPGTRTGQQRQVTVTAGGDAKALADAQRAEDVMRDLEQAFGDLFERAAAGTLKLTEFDRTVRELGDTFESRLRTPTEAQAAAFAALQDKAAQVRDLLRDLHARKAADDFEALLAAATPTAIDNLERELVQLQERIAQFREAGALIDPAAEQALLDIQRARLQNAREEEALERQLRTVRQQAISDFDAQLVLQGAIADKQAEVAQLTGEDAVSQTRRKSLLEQIEKLKAKIAELTGKDATASAHTVEASRSWARELADVATIALGVSTTLSGANDELTRAIGATAQLFAGFDQVAGAIAKAGSLTAALSSGGGIVGLLAGVGGIIGGVGTLAGLFKRSEDPAEVRRREILEENNRRLAELRDRIGELVRVSLSGRDLAAIRSVSFTTTEPRIDIGTLGPGQGVLTPFDRPSTAGEVITRLRAAGVSLDELRQAAADFGITLSQSPTVEELQQLQDAVKTFSLKQLLDTFAGASSVLERRFQIFDLEDPIAQAQALVDTVSRFTPAFAEAIRGIDLTTEEGRRQAEHIIQEFFTRATESGELSAEEITALFGDLTPEELLDALAQMETALDRADQAVRSFADTLLDTFSEIELNAEIFGTDLADVINEKLGALGLDQFDLGTAEGREAALEALRDMARATEDEALKRVIADVVRSLGGLPELPEAVGEAVVDAMAKGVGGGRTLTSALQTLTIHQGDRLITIGESQLLTLRRIESVLAATLRPVPALQPPAIPGFGANLSAAASGSVVVHVQLGPVTVQPPPSVMDPSVWAQQFAMSSVDQINQQLANDVAFRRFLAGSRLAR